MAHMVTDPIRRPPGDLLLVVLLAGEDVELVVRAGAPARTASQDPGAASPQDALPAEGEGGEGSAPAPRTDVDDALVGKVSKVLSALGPRARRDTRLAGRRGSILEEASAGL